MTWWSEFEGRTTREVPLGPMTWFRLGGNARYLFRPRDADDLASFMRRAKTEGLDVKILGTGANVLVRDDGFDGVVVRLDQPAFREVSADGDSDGIVHVGGGADLMPLARELSGKGLAGLEGMAGIPASVGGAVRMNAGGRFGEFGDVVRDVTLMQDDGTVEVWPRERIGFRYRGTDIGKRMVLSATLELRADDPATTAARYERHFSFKQSSQPMSSKSAGCIFKNPIGDSAGAMIDRAGLKGYTCGGASVSELHANFIITQPGAGTSDVLRLIDAVRERVRSMFQTELELEVDVW